MREKNKKGINEDGSRARQTKDRLEREKKRDLIVSRRSMTRKLRLFKSSFSLVSINNSSVLLTC